ncbi:MAG TPA: 4,5-DOPA dioxygenase extradiol [Nevskiaceae bacterium]
MTATAARMPAVFFGHGSPLNALAENRYTEAWRALAATWPAPRAIVAISAHWLSHGTAVTAMEMPPTIHDFGGFPRALFEMQYPAPGAPRLAERIAALLAPVPVYMDQKWGLDHGTWSVLCKCYPDADVPVVQLSIDVDRPATAYLELGSRLSALRDEGVLVMGTGNVVHNLRVLDRREDAPPRDWALRFEARVKQCLLEGRIEALAGFQQWGDDAARALPSVEHFLPLLYVLGTRREGEAIRVPFDGIAATSISMLSAVVGALA